MVSHQLDGKTLEGDGKYILDTLTNVFGQITRSANDEAGYEMYGYSPVAQMGWWGETAAEVQHAGLCSRSSQGTGAESS